MIIVRSPLRIPLGGGGTDLVSYSRKFGGFCLSAAIDKYVYIILHEAFQREIILKYSKLERVSNASEIEHPIIREAFLRLGLDTPNLEIASMADIPAGTGLGSSSAFACAILKALRKPLGDFCWCPQTELAEDACKIEKQNPGRQDQYISACGGIKAFHFHTDDSVEINKPKLDAETIVRLEDNLLLLFTGFSRESSSILTEQDTQIKKSDHWMIENLHAIKNIGYEIKDALEAGKLETFAELLNCHWDRKRIRSVGISNPHIDEWHALALKNGAIGGKLVGAGGGGFLLFYCENKARCREVMVKAGLREVRFHFDFEGTKFL